MLPSQRHLFDLPRDVCFFNAASWSPLPLAVQRAGREAVGRKGQPWLLDRDFADRQNERARTAAARLIHASPDDVALVSSVGYGVATAAKIITVARGARVLVIADDHSSPVLEWQSRAEAGGFSVDVVPRPADGDWTPAVLSAVERKNAPPLALASISSVHWSDGGIIDLAAVQAALKAAGAGLLVDATHAVGVIALDVGKLDPDFVAFPTYKWLLGPYGRAFLYVAKRHQDGVPLEQTSYGRRSVRAEADVYFKDTGYVASARRYDMGERDHFISMEMAAIGMEMLATWGQSAIVDRLAMLTERLAAGLAECGAIVPAARVRAPHILSITPRTGSPATIVERLGHDNVHVALRLGRIRISPHVYNDDADVARFVEVFKRVTA